MTSPRPLALPCACCGEVHSREIGFRLPDLALAIPPEEASRLVGDKDHLVVDRRAFFIRALAPIPLLFAYPPDTSALDPAQVIRAEADDEPRFGIGFWIQVSEAAHRDYVQCEAAFLAGNPRPHATYEGRVANQFDLGGHSLGTAVRASFRPPTYGPVSPAEYLLAPGDRTHVLWGSRPEIHALDAESWLGRLQRDGLTPQAHAVWMARCAHPEEPEAMCDPFAAHLETHGWMVLTAEETGRPPHAFAAPPSPGDFTKLLMRFLSVDAEGEVAARNAGWWVRLDGARGALWTGTLFSTPPQGSPLARGARVWFAPEAVVGHQPAAA